MNLTGVVYAPCILTVKKHIQTFNAKGHKNSTYYVSKKSVITQYSLNEICAIHTDELKSREHTAQNYVTTLTHKALMTLLNSEECALPEKKKTISYNCLDMSL